MSHYLAYFPSAQVAAALAAAASALAGAGVDPASMILGKGGKGEILSALLFLLTGRFAGAAAPAPANAGFKKPGGGSRRGSMNAGTSLLLPRLFIDFSHF
jgi:hypothetical protein